MTPAAVKSKQVPEPKTMTLRSQSQSHLNAQAKDFLPSLVSQVDGTSDKCSYNIDQTLSLDQEGSPSVYKQDINPGS